MTELEQIHSSLAHRSDKWHPYFEIYTRHLSRFRDMPITLVEVGVQRGGSLEMWGKFFPNAKIIGIDSDRSCLDLVYDNPNIQVMYGDQGDPTFWDVFFEEHPVIDVLIDDGGHLMHQQVLTLEKCFPHVKIGGIYITEDTHTSYMPEYQGELFHPSTFVEYSKVAVDMLNADWRTKTIPEFERRLPLFEGLSGVFFYDSVVVFEKFGKREMKRSISGE